MYIECTAIIIILAVLIFEFLRRGYKQHAVMTTPLFLLPFIHLAGGVIGRYMIEKLLQHNPYWVRISMDLLAVAVTALLVGILTMRLKTKKAKYIYSILYMSYTCVLGLILVLDMVPNLIKVI